MTINVTIWNEGRHERQSEKVRAVYPDGIDGALAAGLADPDFTIRRATLDDPDQGLPDDVLEKTDVLLWWGHLVHDEVDDALAERVQKRVLAGMGLVVLHSGHHSKPFTRLMGTSCNLSWRQMPEGELERVWTINPAHPIAEGVAAWIDVPQSEMYGEPFDIPQPDELVFVSWFAGGEVFRSGCTYRRGRGRIFYFAPGHETYPIYHDAKIIAVIANAARWARQPHRTGAALEVIHRPEPLSG